MWFVTNMKNQLRCTHCASVSHQTHSPGLWSGSNIWGNSSCSLNVAYFGIRQQLWKKSTALQTQMLWSDLGGVHQLPVATQTLCGALALSKLSTLCLRYEVRHIPMYSTNTCSSQADSVRFINRCERPGSMRCCDSVNMLPAFLLSSRALAQKTRHFRSLSKRCTCASQTGTWHSHL